LLPAPVPGKQRDVLANLLIEKSGDLAFNIHGCRVVQCVRFGPPLFQPSFLPYTFLQVAELRDDRYSAKLLRTLDERVVDLAKDQYGVHILTKIIDNAGIDVIDKELKPILLKYGPELARSSTGSRVISRIFETEKLNDFTDLFVRR